MKRIHALDGLRGVLALVVVVRHIDLIAGIRDGLFWPFQVAVWAFFAMSAMVLVRGYDGNYCTFPARRAVRLWPVYFVCLVALRRGLGRSDDAGASLVRPSRTVADDRNLSALADPDDNR
jgi:hypothetical protein